MLILLLICFPFLYYLIYKRNNFLSHLALFIVAIAFSDFSKRVIYLYGTDLKEWYYPILLLPDTVFFCVLIVSLPKVNKIRFWIVLTFLFLTIAYSLMQNDIASVFSNVKTIYWYFIILILPSKYFDVSFYGMKDYYLFFVCLCLLAGGYGFFQFIFGYFSWELKWFEFSPTKIGIQDVTSQNRVYRAFSFFSGIQEAGLIYSNAILLMIMRKKKNAADLIINSSIILLLAIALVTTGAKAVWVGLFICLVLFALKIPQKPLVSFTAICSPMIILAILSKSSIYQLVLFVRSFFPAGVSNLIDPGSLLPRLDIYLNFFNSLNFDVYFIFGHGIGSTVGLTKSFVYFDNMYLQILSEFGIVGIVVFFSIIYLSFRAYAALNNSVLFHHERTLLNVSMCFEIIVLIHLYTSQSFLMRSILILFICSLMLIFNLHRKYILSH
jgi:hypothetical protein